MGTHLSARLAWHMDGWNGRICRDPAANTYCVGSASYPGEMIAEQRDLAWESQNAGRCCGDLDRMPPCMYSLNAFGPKELTAFADPPDFFRDGTKRRSWSLPAATVCVWPYDEMYNAEGVRREEGHGFDYDERLKRAREYWSKIEPDRSLIFYYANYSNPFSEEDAKKYVVVGVSRVKRVGEIMFYENCSAQTKQKYGGGFVWQLPVTSHYPDQGLRLPYHVYRDRPEVLERFVCVPENARNFKYATRPFGDDEALVLVEQLLGKVTALRELGDRTEDWSLREAWLQLLIAELWRCRGLYPGLPKVLDLLGFTRAIQPYREQAEQGREKDAYGEVFALLQGNRTSVPWLDVSADELRKVARQWKLRSPEERRLLKDVLPRFDLHVDQLARILVDDRESNGIRADLREIADNPYVLSEQFTGDGPDDTIAFSKIDHGVHPSPDLGGEPLGELDDWRRLRALCVERLRREDKHTFLPAARVIHDVNHRLSFLPGWKRHQFHERYLEVDEEELTRALTYREHDDRRFLYLREIHEDERLVEETIRGLADRPDIAFRSPVTLDHWKRYLHNERSDLARKNAREYGAAIQGQAEVCQKVFVRPVCVVSGAAGTGKTTIISALIKAIEKAHGTGTSFQLLAPTGKAADRIRDRVGKDATTIHSFLAQRGWLNDNMTFRRGGGTREQGKATYIIDEASMVDLELMAALFRAVNFASVQRLILVGDPNQLPPIGRGRVFADIIDWVRSTAPENVGTLAINIRQMESRLTGRGTGILDLASLYTRTDGSEDQARNDAYQAEEVLKRVQEGGDVTPDLRVVYWNGADDLAAKLKEAVVADLQSDTGETLDPERPFDLWRSGFQDEPERYQVISPYRGEPFGTENLNLILQEARHGRAIEHGRHLGGIGLFDKVIQVINRPKSNPAYGFNTSSRKKERVEVFNGELGFSKPHGFDGSKWRYADFQIRQFQVVFSRKPDFWVEYRSESEASANLELAYAISVHKSQGSEFGRVYFVVPKHKAALLSRELFYTGLTRASRHCTLLIEEDISPLVSMRRPERSYLAGVNSSLFEFRPIPEALQNLPAWYEEGKIHRTLADVMVRSKSEVILANMLFERDIPFLYEVPLYAPDGTFYLPDFTITARGETWYWEHLGLLDREEYRNHWETKRLWYEANFPGRLLVTRESGELSRDADAIISEHLG